MHACMHAFMNAYIHYNFTHIYMHAYIHTYVRTSIHTCIRTSPRLGGWASLSWRPLSSWAGHTVLQVSGPGPGRRSRSRPSALSVAFIDVYMSVGFWLRSQSYTNQCYPVTGARTAGMCPAGYRGRECRPVGAPAYVTDAHLPRTLVHRTKMTLDAFSCLLGARPSRVCERYVARQPVNLKG